MFRTRFLFFLFALCIDVGKAIPRVSSLDEQVEQVDSSKITVDEPIEVDGLPRPAYTATKAKARFMEPMALRARMIDLINEYEKIPIEEREKIEKEAQLMRKSLGGRPPWPLPGPGVARPYPGAPGYYPSHIGPGYPPMISSSYPPPGASVPFYPPGSSPVALPTRAAHFPLSPMYPPSYPAIPARRKRSIPLVERKPEGEWWNGVGEDWETKDPYGAFHMGVLDDFDRYGGPIHRGHIDKGSFSDYGHLAPAGNYLGPDMDFNTGDYDSFNIKPNFIGHDGLDGLNQAPVNYGPTTLPNDYSLPLSGPIDYSSLSPIDHSPRLPTMPIDHSPRLPTMPIGYSPRRPTPPFDHSLLPPTPPIDHSLLPPTPPIDHSLLPPIGYNLLNPPRGY